MLFFVAGLLFASGLRSQSLYFPPVSGSEWATLPPESLNFCPDKVQKLYEFLDKKESKAFILLKDGKIVLEKYFDNHTKDSLWYWASAGKTLTAFLFGIAAEEKSVDLNQKTSFYLGKNWTSLSESQEEQIKVLHQLTMTTGLDDGVADRDCTLPACLKFKAAPGTRWAYHNAPYTLLDKVLEKATGKNLNQYVAEKILLQTGISGLFVRTNGFNNVFFSTPRSFARFGLLLLNKGTWNGKEVLKDKEYFSKMTNSSQNLNPSYGYLTWLNGKSKFMLPTLQTVFNGDLVPDAPDDAFFALGKNGQIIAVIPSENMVFIRMGEEEGNNLVPTTLPNDIWKQIKQLACDKPTGVEDENYFAELKVYPNPTKDFFVIDFAFENNFKTEVFDLTGRKITEFENTKNIKLKPDNKTCLLLKISSGNNYVWRKLFLE